MSKCIGEASQTLNSEPNSFALLSAQTVTIQPSSFALLTGLNSTFVILNLTKSKLGYIVLATLFDRLLVTC